MAAVAGSQKGFAQCWSLEEEQHCGSVLCSGWPTRATNAQGPATGVWLAGPLLLLLGVMIPAVAATQLMLTSSDVSNFMKVSRRGCSAASQVPETTPRHSESMHDDAPPCAMTNLIRRDPCAVTAVKTSQIQVYIRSIHIDPVFAGLPWSESAGQSGDL